MSTTTQHPPSLQGKAEPVTGAASWLADTLAQLPAPAGQAQAAGVDLAALAPPPATVVAELTGLPLRESSRP